MCLLLAAEFVTRRKIIKPHETMTMIALSGFKRSKKTEFSPVEVVLL